MVRIERWRAVRRLFLAADAAHAGHTDENKCDDGHDRDPQLPTSEGCTESRPGSSKKNGREHAERNAVFPHREAVACIQHRVAAQDDSCSDMRHERLGSQHGERIDRHMAGAQVPGECARGAKSHASELALQCADAQGKREEQACNASVHATKPYSLPRHTSKGCCCAGESAVPKQPCDDEG